MPGSQTDTGILSHIIAKPQDVSDQGQCTNEWVSIDDRHMRDGTVVNTIRSSQSANVRNNANGQENATGGEQVDESETARDDVRAEVDRLLAAGGLTTRDELIQVGTVVTIFQCATRVYDLKECSLNYSMNTNPKFVYSNSHNSCCQF